MNRPALQVLAEHTMRIEGAAKPSGLRRWTSCVRYLADNRVRFRSDLVCKVDEVFRPERQDDGSFGVANFDGDKFFAPVVHDGADYYVAVGRYLDEFHGTVVATFVRPASPSEVARFTTPEAQDHAA